ncbi:MAG: 8-oxoguanine DNA glycosylase [Oscillospiraceae bacterium]|nr:8-oxoguanine DNA glycosylase [Oscillospiraceae bacterium]
MLNVYKDGRDIVFKGICEGDIQELVSEYFDLNYDYEQTKYELSNVDVHLKCSIEYGYGIRILNQDLWETIISYIISANNNIPRIKGIIERISKAYGRKISWNDKEYYTFPTYEELGQARVEDLRKLGLGFRDKRVYETTKIMQKGDINLENLKEEHDISRVKEVLMFLPGVGPKVAECVMLFGLSKKEIFPIDVWVERVMNELYTDGSKGKKLSKQEIEELAKEKYGDSAGIAQQYLFYWRREIG